MSDDLLVLLRDDGIPGTLSGFVERFSSEEACAELLRRWKYGEQGFRCPRCGGRSAWFLPSRRLDECTSCHKQVSLTSGTVMHGSRKPLRLWFLAMFLFVVSKQGISALDLSRQLGVTPKTAWTWLHKLRSAGRVVQSRSCEEWWRRMRPGKEGSTRAGAGAPGSARRRR